MKTQHNIEISVVQGDITTLKMDAIVNAANTQLLLGSGVAGAIRVKAGPSIQAECNNHGPVPLGGAAITGAGDLPAKFVIHAAGMHLGESVSEDTLRDTTLAALKLATQNKIESIAFPAIGTGVGGLEINACAQIMLAAVGGYDGQGFPKQVIFCLFDEASRQAFEKHA